jgi:hypothetical protein
MIFAAWAARWGIPPAAMAELQTGLLQLDGTPGRPGAGGSEAAVQSQVRLEASRKGGRLWRNNVGAGYAEDGSFMRWGLANDSAQVNRVIKSADLIGLRPVLIEQKHVGLVLGQFVSREVKAYGWTYCGTEREVAQLNWATLVNTLGGDACFATGEGTL